MKKTITLSFICLFIFYTTNAQWRELGGTMSVRLGNTSSTSYSNNMAMDDSGNVFICGDFLNSSMEYFISKYNKKTSTWAELGGIATGGVPLKANFPVGYLLTDHKGNVYATGGFTNSLGNQYLAKWAKLTNSWTSVGTIIPEGKILKDKADNIYVNSSDTTPSGRRYDYIAK